VAEVAQTTVIAARPRSAERRAGVRAGLSFGVATVLLALTFGDLARRAGMTPLESVVMSALVFNGTAQIAALAAIADGAGVWTAVATLGLVSARWIAMSIALTPSLPGGRWRKALQAQTLTDVSWAMARRENGFDRNFLFAMAIPLYVSWVGGTALGAAIHVTTGPVAEALAAVLPLVVIAVLLGEMRDGPSRLVAAGGAIVALATVPLLPPGLPVLASAAAVVLGLRGARE
jgi:predicted branched-subunit amino acid permease